MVQAIEFAVGFLILWGSVTQVIIPAFRRTRLFPMFSKERRNLAEHGTDVHERRDLRDIAQEIDAEDPDIRTKRRNRNSGK